MRERELSEKEVKNRERRKIGGILKGTISVRKGRDILLNSSHSVLQPRIRPLKQN
jgi:hypothetical protein